MKKKGKRAHTQRGIKFTIASKEGEAPSAEAIPPEQAKPQRRFPRVPAETSIIVRSLGGDIKGELTKTKILGKGGLCFIQDKSHGVGSTLFLSIQVGWDLVEARVRVVYEMEREGGSYEVGVEFEETTPGGIEVLERLLKANHGSAG